jgi:hypothetical protein
MQRESLEEKRLFGGMISQPNHGLMMRLKPWEAFKA